MAMEEAPLALAARTALPEVRALVAIAPVVPPTMVPQTAPALAMVTMITTALGTTGTVMAVMAVMAVTAVMTMMTRSIMTARVLLRSKHLQIHFL
jgi:hypothetical protein